MPGSCYAPGCSNRGKPGSTLSFCRIPSGDSFKENSWNDWSVDWNGLMLFAETNGLKKKSETLDWTCSAHFVSGR